MKRTIKWFEDAKPNPTIEDVCVQMGCHIEEIAEMMSTLDNTNVAIQLFDLARKYKQKDPELLQKLEGCDRLQLTDDMCDQIFTAIGVGVLFDLNIENNYNAVEVSNDSKRNQDGTFNFDENGKITKPPHYVSPEILLES